jgi:ABC-type antimicrobial peptide transport system permease subunit
MPFFYAIEHLFRSWKLFLALLIGITLACTFFAGIDIKTNATARLAYEAKLSSVYVDMEFELGWLDSPQIYATILRNIVLHIEEVSDAEIISGRTGLSLRSFDKNDSIEYGVELVAISSGSHVYSGWSNKPTLEIAENETYIPESSPLAKKVKIGDTVEVGFPVYISQGNWTYIPLNLTVKGFAQLDDKAYSIASNYFSTMTSSPGIEVGISQTAESRFAADLLLVNWGAALKNVMEQASLLNPFSSPLETSLLIYLNRDLLITPWDIDSSINNIYTVLRKVNQEGGPVAGGAAVDYLAGPLESLRSAIMGMRFSSIVISLTVFFIAWYVGTTVSNVSFNLRRREIGLLSTKGFSRGQILSVFLTETLLIGFIGGILGLLLGLLLVRMSTQFSMAELLSPYLLSAYTVIFTMVFGIVMALLSTFSSARKASQLPAVNALREYLPAEEVKPYRNKWPWIALVLGTYKLGVFFLGINMYQALTSKQTGQNLVLLVIIAVFAFVDLALTYVGPLLFFWGFTKLFIQSSLKFQQLASKAAGFLGDLGALAAKSLRRNPARSAAVAFLIALIVGYSTQVTCQLASEQDYARRQAYFQVGADLAVHVATAGNAMKIMTAIMGNTTGQIQDATIEYSIQTSAQEGASMEIRAIMPTIWPKIAFFESSWFSGSDAATAFNYLNSDKYTIILDKSIAQLYSLGIGDSINVRFGSTIETLKIVGFFGPGLSMESQQGGTNYWSSFVSNDLYQDLNSEISSSAEILMKLENGVDGRAVAVSILNLEGSNINSAESFAQNWSESQTDIIKMASVDVQKFAVIIAVLAASVGTALVSAVSMKERSREASLMGVKGLSYKQLAVMFLTEHLAVVTFSVAIGLMVGVIVTYGNISFLDSYALSVIRHGLIFTFDTTLMLVSCIALIFISTVLPILIMLRKYVTKLERVVRLR